MLRTILLLVMAALWLAACGGNEGAGTAVVISTLDPALFVLPSPTLAATSEVLPTATQPLPATMSATVPAEATLPPPTATLPPPTATLLPTAVPTNVPPPSPTPLLPPRTRSNLPAGSFPADHVAWNLITDDNFLFRFQVHDMNQGNVDGAGIVSVKFVISDFNGNRLYTSTESTSGYCVFRGGEPNCNPWVMEDGRYRWGSGGPELVSGDYFASIYVTPLVVDPNDPFDIDPDDPAGNPVWRWSFDFHVDVP